MTSGEIECFEGYLKNAQTYLEFGAGGSTVLAAKNSRLNILTVESDQKWLTVLAESPSVKAAASRLELLHVDIGETAEWGKPKDETKKLSWRNYPTAPWSRNYTPDLVMIDGRFRVACAIHAAINRPKATILIHDYKWRNFYSPVEEFLDLVSSTDSLGVFRAKNFDRNRAETLLKNYEYDFR